MNEDLRLAELMASLSLGIDLGVGQPLEWILRSCLLGVRLGQALNLNQADLQEVYYLSLLRHIGCTANAPSDARIFGDELGLAELLTADPEDMGQMMRLLIRLVGKGQPAYRRIQFLARVFSMGTALAEDNHRAQCEVAARLAEMLGFEASMGEAIGQIYEQWNGKGFPNGLQGEAIRRSVRVIHLAQDAATFYALGGLDTAVKIIRERAGRLYDPAFAEQFFRSASELFTGFDAPSLWDTVLAAEPGGARLIAPKAMDSAFQVVGDFADMKSPYTLGHSRAVAELAGAAAYLCRFPPGEVEAVRYAGYLHDLGRVAITSALWCKSGALTASEWEKVRLHPYYMERIFARSPALKPFADLAALHHERLDGSGYYRGVAGTMIPASARVLAAANFYCALVEGRPHRPPQSPAQAADTLYAQAKAGQIDTNAVDAVISASRAEDKPVRRSATMQMSDRELEVLRLLAPGSSNKQIARQLVISEKTVEHHITHIYNKMGVSTRAAATLYAMQNHLL